jgi:cold-inducible RNA-binding protein
MDIFVGNLSFDSTESDVKKLFEGFGNVVSVVIVMEKEKKAPKSRGFGFVNMSDEQQALAAIAALNGKEFMGRPLDVNPARSKVAPEVKRHPLLNKPGEYGGGRRTYSYIKRRELAGMPVEVKPRRRSHDNPMRWRKKEDQAKPWQKSPGEHKPWKKPAGEAKPWKKTEGEARPWKKAEGGSKPWKKPLGDAKPWKKPAGEAKPWKKTEGGARPWKKAEFKGQRKPGGYKR